MKKIYILALIFVFLCPLFAFLGCTPLFRESAICKIGNKKFDTLSQAIEFCEGGETIEVYNSVIRDNSHTFLTQSVDGKDFVQYVLTKNIMIKGINQNSKRPAIYGAILIDSASTVTLQNLEIVNDYISLENDAVNLPFINAVLVKNGNVCIESCFIHAAKSIDNQIVQQHGLSLLSGLLVSRGEKLAGKKLVYDIKNNTFSDYQTHNEKSSSYAVSFFAREGGISLEPFNLNYLTNNDFSKFLDLNKFSNNLTPLQVKFDEKYQFLSTSFENLIVSSNFYDKSNVFFNKALFGPEEQILVFEVYGKMNFNAVQNVHFIMKNATASVKRNVSQDKNVDVTVYKDLSF